MIEEITGILTGKWEENYKSECVNYVLSMLTTPTSVINLYLNRRQIWERANCLKVIVQVKDTNISCLYCSFSGIKFRAWVYHARIYRYSDMLFLGYI